MAIATPLYFRELHINIMPMKVKEFCQIIGKQILCYKFSTNGNFNRSSFERLSPWLVVSQGLSFIL